MERPWNIRGTSVERSWNAQGTGAWIPSPRKTDGRKMSVWENKTDRQNERSKEMNIRKVRVMLGILSPSLIRLGNERKIFNCSGYKMSEKDFFPWAIFGEPPPPQFRCEKASRCRLATYTFCGQRQLQSELLPRGS